MSLIFTRKLRTIEPRQNFAGSYKKKRVVPSDSKFNPVCIFDKNQQLFAKKRGFFALKLFLILVEAQSFSILENLRKERCS